MGFRDWLWGRSDEKRSITLADFPAFASILAAPDAAGMVVNESTALTLRAYYQGVGIISGWCGILPLVTYRRTANDERKRATTLPAYRVLREKPNRNQVPLVFWQTLMGHVLTYGNGYAEIEFDKAQRPIGLHNIDPRTIEPVMQGDMLAYRYKGQRMIPQSDVLHVPGLGFDGVKGYSVVAMARRSLGGAMAAEQFGASFFSNGAMPGIVLKHPKTLSPGAQERLIASFEQRHRGPGQAMKTMVAEEGMGVEKIGIPPEDAQFLETKEFGIVDVAGWLNIPPHMLGHKFGEWPGGTPEAADRQFFTHTLLTWLVRISQECDRKLLPEGGGYYTEHLPEKLLSMSPGEKATNYQAYISMGVMTPETVAKKENLPPPPPPPKPAPATAPPPMDDPKERQAFRSLMVDVVSRWSKREAERARRASKKPAQDFGAWVEEFYGGEAQTLRGWLAPLVEMQLARRGIEANSLDLAGQLADGYIQDSKDQLLGLRHDHLGVDVERLMVRWEAGRAKEMADKIAALGAVQGEGNAA